MPRYAVSTFLNQEQNKKVDEAVKILGKSKYAVMRDAVLSYCEAVIKEKGENERKREAEPEAEPDGREDTGGDFESENGGREDTSGSFESEDIFG